MFCNLLAVWRWGDVQRANRRIRRRRVKYGTMSQIIHSAVVDGRSDGNGGSISCRKYPSRRSTAPLRGVVR